MIGSIIALLFASVVLWEHFGSLNNLDARPTLLIGNCTGPFKKMCISGGEWVARAGSYIYEMHLKEIARSMWNLCNVMFEFILTPVWTIKGYIDYAYQNYDSPYVIYIGSGLQVVLILYLIYRYRETVYVKRVVKFLFTYQHVLFWLAIFFLMAGFGYYTAFVHDALNITVIKQK